MNFFLCIYHSAIKSKGHIHHLPRVVKFKMCIILLAFLLLLPFLRYQLLFMHLCLLLNVPLNKIFPSFLPLPFYRYKRHSCTFAPPPPPPNNVGHLGTFLPFQMPVVIHSPLPLFKYHWSFSSFALSQLVSHSPHHFSHINGHLYPFALSPVIIGHSLTFAPFWIPMVTCAPLTFL